MRRPPLTYASVAIADESRIAGAFVALRNVGARGIVAAASVVAAAMDHSCNTQDVLSCW
jgi:hypothetical protein